MRRKVSETSRPEELRFTDQDFSKIVPCLNEVFWGCLEEADKSLDPIKISLDESSIAMLDYN